MMKEQERKTVHTYMRQNDPVSLNNMGELLGDLRLEDDLIVGEPMSRRSAKKEARPAAPAAEKPAAPAEPSAAAEEEKSLED
jgi:hypothetical protein